MPHSATPFPLRPVVPPYRIRVLSVNVLSPHLPHASRRRERCVGSLNSTPAVPPACPCLTPRPCFGSWLVPALLHQHAAGPWPPPRLPGLREHAAPRRRVRLYIGTVSTSPASFRQIGHNLFLRLQQLHQQHVLRQHAGHAPQAHIFQPFSAETTRTDAGPVSIGAREHGASKILG